MSERKLSNSTALDPVTLAVLKGRLEQVADEMDATLYRSAFNPIIAEAHDACHGIYDGVSGDTLVQGKSGLPVFVGAMAFAVRAAAKAAATRGGMQDGDIWLFNDPYEGGTHANDFKLVRPFFRDGQLFCFLASAAHWHDVGGAVPGNYNPAATECWQEAVQIPPVRILRAGVLDQDVLAILRANTRLPDSLWGDLNGQLAALELGAKRLNGLLDEYGDAKVAQAMVELRSRAVRLMRSHIASLPDGCYSFEDVLDNDGVVDTPLTIALDMTVNGDRLTLDFSRTSAQCAGPVNISKATAVAACYVALKHVFPDVPANAGVLDAVDFVLPEGLVITEKEFDLDPEHFLASCRSHFQLPVFVKPSRSGSSVGVSKVKSFDELESAIVEAFAHDNTVLVETAVVGREVECDFLQILAAAPRECGCAQWQSRFLASPRPAARPPGTGCARTHRGAVAAGAGQPTAHARHFGCPRRWISPKHPGLA